MDSDRPPPIPEPPRPTEPPPPVPWRALEAIPVWAVAFVAGLLAAGVGALGRGGDGPTAFAVLASEVLLALVVIVWVRMRHGVGMRALGAVRPEAGDVSLGLGAGLLGVLGSVVIVFAVLAVGSVVAGHPVEVPEQIPLGEPSAAVLAIVGIAVVVAAPIAEEMFFRGFLYRALRRWASPALAGLISAAIFAASHVEPLIIPSIFALGLVLAWLVERRGGRLAPAIMAHGLFNLVGFVFRFLLK
ncbi:MAG: CPBP family intramembrane metalloprotease [Acidobacteria bacterium]|nr:CPBP family intramembrane metalloprotease [Acidobacteriota bacterium]